MLFHASKLVRGRTCGAKTRPALDRRVDRRVLVIRRRTNRSLHNILITKNLGTNGLMIRCQKYESFPSCDIMPS